MVKQSPYMTPRQFTVLVLAIMVAIAALIVAAVLFPIPSRSAPKPFIIDTNRPEAIDAAFLRTWQLVPGTIQVGAKTIAASSDTRDTVTIPVPYADSSSYAVFLTMMAGTTGNYYPAKYTVTKIDGSRFWVNIEAGDDFDYFWLTVGGL